MTKYIFYNIIFFSCLYQQNAIAASYNYDVVITKNLSDITVELCFKNSLNTQNISLVAQDNVASGRISNIRLQRDNTTENIKLRNNTITLNKVSTKNCLRYQSDLVFSASRKFPSISRAKQIITDPKHWLWLPKSFNKTDNIKINFSHPPQIRISAPWILLNRNKTTSRYTINKTPSSWDSLVAFGDFKIKDITIKNATIRYALLNGQKKLDGNKIYNWLDNNLRALTSVYNKFPVDTLQILVIPLGGGNDPVPWGQVMRGGGDAVHLYIDDTRSKQEFMADWVLSHELSHLLLPRITANGAWLSEGLASYYQNVIRARQGLITTKQAWLKLHAGFERGINKTPKHKNLEQVTRSMRQNRNYMRVYWSGAAISLIADVRLRRLSANKMSLDKALYLLQECCLSNPRRWSPQEIMLQLDELTKTQVFTEILTANIYSTQFPDLQQVYQILGFEGQKNTLFILDNPRSALRDTIMTRH